jgi:pimeloyl-ACP methyl ester carboxylesterase
MTIAPFEIHIPESALTDLRHRLAAARWPPAVDDTGWTEGSSAAYMRTLVQYWQHDYDWRAQERRLNAVPQFRIELDGFTIHYLHVRSSRPDATPLLMCHGWPGGNLEFLAVSRQLAEPEDRTAPAFHVIAPAMPGYGFSSVPTRSGVNVTRIADLWAQLMTALGYPRFGVQGGDWGAWVAIRMCRDHASRLLGAHLNYVPARYLPAPGSTGSDLTAEDRAYLSERQRWIDNENGYGHIQGTKPQTLAMALSDSPLGLAAWIVEKFHGWSDCGGDLQSVFTADELLTNVCVYWFTNTIYSSMRLYKEVLAELAADRGPAVRPTTRVAVARFPKEIVYPPRSHLERYFNIVRWTEMPAGGHFAALEQPVLLSRDIQAFFGALDAR